MFLKLVKDAYKYELRKFNNYAFKISKYALETVTKKIYIVLSETCFKAVLENNNWSK